MNIPALKLHTDDLFPQIGLGMWKVSNERCPSLIREAVEAGYRHFDCACDYGNEAAVGEGLKEVFDSGLVKREEVWVTSKLWNTYHRKAYVRAACEKTLADLGLEYLDLYLVHFPIASQFVPFDEHYPPGWISNPGDEHPRMIPDAVPIIETWEAMEGLKEAGLVKNIGVCNFGVSLLRDLLSQAGDRPAVLQVESHPYLTQEKLLRFCGEQEIAYTAFSPFGALAYHELDMAEETDSLLEVEVITEIAGRYGRSPAQVLLRWGVQRGTAVIPKTSNTERLAENISIFDFELSEAEMEAIGKLNKNHRYNDPGVFCEKAFGTFFPIYE